MVGGVHDAGENMSILCSKRQAEMRVKKREVKRSAEQTKNTRGMDDVLDNNGRRLKNERGRS